MRRPYPDDDITPVIVPQNDRALVTVPPERIQRLRAHLTAILASTRSDEPPSIVRRAPDGFQAKVARTACSPCRGWCCKRGEDDGFLDEATLARVPTGLVSATGLIDMYAHLVPDAGFENSCIFHGASGCTSHRSMRSDVCNAYYCDGLSSFIQSTEPDRPTVVISGEITRMRLSPILTPE